VTKPPVILQATGHHRRFQKRIGGGSDGPASTGRRCFQGVIRSQVEALGRDDAATAYSYAAPAIHDLFPQAEIFMDMVRRSYTPVYRHKSFEFGEARASGGQIAQRVHIVDADGIPWEALYTLELEPDGSVKISGCVLLRPGQAV
jgi:Domain of unknown function (DUF4864)